MLYKFVKRVQTVSASTADNGKDNSELLFCDIFTWTLQSCGALEEIDIDHCLFSVVLIPSFSPSLLSSSSCLYFFLSLWYIVIFKLPSLFERL